MDYLQTAKISRENQPFETNNFQTFEILTLKLYAFEKKKLTCKIGNCPIFVIPSIQNLVRLS